MGKNLYCIPEIEYYRDLEDAREEAKAQGIIEGKKEADRAISWLLFNFKNGTLSEQDLHSMFNIDADIVDIIINIPIDDIITALQNLNKNYIRVGDICTYAPPHETPFIVTKISYEGGDGFFDAIYADGGVIYDGTLKQIRKADPNKVDITPVTQFLQGLCGKDKENFT